MAYAKRKRMGEELDIFDVVLEFLQAEGFAETLEEAEWMMANVIDEEAIEIIREDSSVMVSKVVVVVMISDHTPRQIMKEVKQMTPERKNK
jgi:hypothetical protein